MNKVLKSDEIKGYFVLCNLPDTVETAINYSSAQDVMILEDIKHKSRFCTKRKVIRSLFWTDTVPRRPSHEHAMQAGGDNIKAALLTYITSI